jgi:RNA polymerase sigma-70 factor (ECF subfamily)
MKTQPLSELNDQQLILAFQKGNDRAFNILIQRHSKKAIAFLCNRITKDVDLTNEIFQESCVRAVQALKKEDYIIRYSFSSWFIQIMKNCYLSMHRKKKVLISIPGISSEDGQESNYFNLLAYAAESPEELYIRKETEQAILFEFDQLPEKMREASKLVIIEDFSNQETAEALGISEDNVRVRVHRARKALMSRIQREAS